MSADVRSNPFTEGRDLHLTTDVDVQQATQAIRQGPAQAGGPAAIDTAAPRSVGYVPVYYPGTPAPAQATLLTLRAGEERGGIDFPLALVPTARVEGTVSSPDGAVPANTSVDLLAERPHVERDRVRRLPNDPRRPGRTVPVRGRRARRLHRGRARRGAAAAGNGARQRRPRRSCGRRRRSASRDSRSPESR